MKEYIDVLEDAREILDALEALRVDAIEWESIQMRIIKTNSLRRPVYNAMTSLRDEFGRSRCAELSDPPIGPEMSSRFTPSPKVA